jgi:FAD:protein FMN transferase
VTTETQSTPYAVGRGPADLPRLDPSPVRAELPRRAFVAQVMGLPVCVHVRGPLAQDDRVAAVVEDAFEALRADDRIFSTYRDDSAVSRIRRGELTVLAAGPRVRRVAALCEVAADRTAGSFSAWRPAEDGRPTFDPTGLVKGWAVEQAFDRLTDRLGRIGWHDVLICAGGDVIVGCERTDTPDWQVGIEDPQDRSRLLLSVPLRRGAVATSGTAARGSHIVNPATLAPATDLLSATVIGPSLTWADVFATAAFVRGPAAQAWVSTLPRHAGILVDLDGRVLTTSGDV